MLTLPYQNATSKYDYFSIFFFPGAFSALTLVTALISLVATTFRDSLLNRSWNVLYDFRNDYKTRYTYIVRIVIFYRKTTVNFETTNMALLFMDLNESSNCLIRVPCQFFEYNENNLFKTQYAEIRFLLIR